MFACVPAPPTDRATALLPRDTWVRGGGGLRDCGTTARGLRGGGAGCSYGAGSRCIPCVGLQWCVTQFAARRCLGPLAPHRRALLPSAHALLIGCAAKQGAVALSLLLYASVTMYTPVHKTTPLLTSRTHSLRLAPFWGVGLLVDCVVLVLRVRAGMDTASDVVQLILLITLLTRALAYAVVLVVDLVRPAAAPRQRRQ